MHYFIVLAVRGEIVSSPCLQQEDWLKAQDWHPPLSHRLVWSSWPSLPISLWIHHIRSPTDTVTMTVSQGNWSDRIIWAAKTLRYSRSVVADPYFCGLLNSGEVILFSVKVVAYTRERLNCGLSLSLWKSCRSPVMMWSLQSLITSGVLEQISYWWSLSTRRSIWSANYMSQLRIHVWFWDNS